MTIPTRSNSLRVQEIVESICARQRFVISSHAESGRRFNWLAISNGLRAEDTRQGGHGRQQGCCVGAIDGVSRRARHRDHRPRRRHVRRRDHHGMRDLRRPEVSGLDRYFVINIDHHPGNANYGPAELVRFDGRRLRRDGLQAHRRAWRTVDDRNRHAHLSGHPDRHRIVPLLEHFAAHLRHLP